MIRLIGCIVLFIMTVITTFIGYDNSAYVAGAIIVACMKGCK